MRYLLIGLLILAAAAALVTAGKTGGGPSVLGTRSEVSGTLVMSLCGDVPEVVVTAERPAWLMPEVVVRANRMPGVVVYATWSPVTVAATSPQANFVN